MPQASSRPRRPWTTRPHDSYSVTVQVTDGKDADGSAETTPTIDDTHDVAITVTDADDPGSLTLSSQSPIVGSTLTATLTDEDDGITGETWKWETSTDQNSWTVITGETTNSYTPDADDENKYLRVTVTYTDDDGSGKTAEAQTTSAVALRAATNVHPSFADETTTREVAENTASGQNIGAPVTATPGDNKGTLKYTLGGTDDTSFSIDTATGQLKTNAPLDHEDKDEYTVTVSVSDELDAYENADTVNDDTITVTITVTDVNEGPTFDSSNTAARDVDENTANRHAFGSGFSVTDPESDTPTYSLAGTDASSFRDIDDGHRPLKTKADLDHETKDTYSVTIQVTDGKAADGSTRAQRPSTTPTP